MKFFSNDPSALNRCAACRITEQLFKPYVLETIVPVAPCVASERHAVWVEQWHQSGYVLTLWYYLPWGIHALSLHSETEDPADLDVNRRDVKQKWQNWHDVQRLLHILVERYGKILIGSETVERNKLYREHLRLDFLIGDWNDPRAGFFILPD